MKVRALVCSLTLAAVTINAMGVQMQLPSVSPPPSPPPLQPTPSEIEIYKAAHTLIDWTPEQIGDCPFLREVRPAANQDQLPEILARVGQTVTMLFRDFPQIACDERITFRSSLRPSPSHGKYRYIVLPRHLKSTARISWGIPSAPGPSKVYTSSPTTSFQPACT